jgi:hypothetical protein
MGAIPASGDEILFRLARKDPLRAADFESSIAKGYEPVRIEDQYVLLTGLSMWEEERLARARARRPGFLAEVHLPAGVGVSLAKTFGDGHYTVWGSPHVLVASSRIIDKIS